MKTCHSGVLGGDTVKVKSRANRESGIDGERNMVLQKMGNWLRH